jgi:DNA-binding MarR family transcriptional regulator
VTRFAGGPADSPGFLLWHLTLRWQREVAAALAPLGLTHVQFVLLACTWWLQGQGHEPHQRDLARQAGTDLAMTSQVLRALEARGLVERRTDARDLRAKRVVLTPAGTALTGSAIPAVEAVDAELLGGPGAELADVLRRLGAGGASSAPPPTA